MRKSIKSLAVIAGLALSATSLAACGSDNATGTAENTKKVETTDISGKLAGAGASSQKSAVEAWKAGFADVAKNVEVTYDPTGSGAGVTTFLQGGVAFAGTDEALSSEEVDKSAAVCKDSKAINLPVYVSPVVVAFNLEGIKTLNMKPETIAKIFRGEITKWNDPAIAADNADAKLPDSKIVAIHRADQSGTTENFTDYLHAAAPSAWPDDPSKDWPVAGGESGDKTAGVVDNLKKTEGAIGYIDASQAGDFGTAALQAGDGFVEYSAEAAAKIVESAKVEDGREKNDLALNLNRTPDDPEAYPLVLVSYYAVCPQYKDANTAKMVKAWVNYVVSADGQQKAAEAAGSAPLGAEITKKITTALDEIK